MRNLKLLIDYKQGMMRTYKAALARYLSNEPDRIFLYWKGRIALYALMKAAGIGPGDEVIMPAFTCVVVPNAVLYSGAKPVYVDIDRKTLNMNVSLLESAITDRTKAVICQNTFGLSSNIEQVQAIAKQHGLILFEDCAHGFGGTYHDKPNGSFCDAAFFSSQWNKPFSTGLGGFLLVNNLDLLTAVSKLESEKETPGWLAVISLTYLLFLKKIMLNDRTYWPVLKLYRFLSKKNLVLGSSQGEELSSAQMPGHYFRDISCVQARHGLKALKKLDNILALRGENGKAYTTFLKKHGKIHVSEDLFADHAFLKYPVFVRDKAEFLKRAEQAFVRLGDWFVSPIHPVQGDLLPWGFEKGKFPNAEDISRKILNLPTDTLNLEKSMSFLNKNLDMIY
ncbi:aminotransferase class I/II-fold pyridoxal phosphate-dependent enzyme [Thermoproteota archaeon]